MNPHKTVHLRVHKCKFKSFVVIDVHALKKGNQTKNILVKI